MPSSSSSAQVWWLFTDFASGDWAVVAASVLLTAGGLVAASARRDPALVSGYRRWAIGLATAALLLAVSVLQETSADSFVDGPLLLLVGAVALMGLSVGVAASAEAKTAGVITEPTTPPKPTASPNPSLASAAAIPSYNGQAARSAADAGLDARCRTAAARTICVDKAQRKLYFLAGDQVVLTLDARCRTANPTREGSFSIYRKDANHTSTLFGSNMPYAMFFSGGEAVHYSSDFAARGYNGHSHGCVNIRDKAAFAWLFDQVPVGTPVYVYS